MTLPAQIHSVLADLRFARSNPEEVGSALARLQVQAPTSFVEFYEAFVGPFWSDSLWVELADLIEEANSIERLTRECRLQFAFPDRYVTLTPLSPGGSVHVLDAERDKVYVVDFEGGEELLKAGKLTPRWESFYGFLDAYF